MTRILSTTALLMSMTATVAFAGKDAATQSNLLSIQQYVPEATMADLMVMEDTRILAIVNEISSGDEGSDRANTVRALWMQSAKASDEMKAAMGNDAGAFTPDGAVSEQNLLTIQKYVPDATMADLMVMEEARIYAILNEINSGDEGGDRAATVRALWMQSAKASDEMKSAMGGGDDVAYAITPDRAVSEQNLLAIQQYVPEATMDELVMMEEKDILAMINEISEGGDSYTETAAVVKSLYQQAL